MVVMIASVLSMPSPFPLRAADDWPQFLGPARNGHSLGAEPTREWPAEGPRVVWKRTVGQGFSGPVVQADRVVVFHRADNRETLECLAKDTGRTLWEYHHPATYRDDFGFDEGPRGTPAIRAGSVFAFGADGVLVCVDLETGQLRWRVDAKQQFGARKGFFGLAGSPLVEDGRVFLNIGGVEGAGLAAFDATSGRLLWKATDHEAGYSSPTPATIDGRPLILFFHRDGLTAAEPAGGKVAFEFPWRARINASVNAAVPLVVGHEVFLSASYDLGAVLLRLRAGPPARVWASDEALSNHYATSVYFEGHLYGFHGRQDTGRPALRCVEWSTGKVRWSRDHFGAGTVMLAGKTLIALHEDGRLFHIEASPAGFKLIQQAQVLPTGVRAHAALADGFLYARNPEQLVCVDLQNRAPK